MDILDFYDYLRNKGGYLTLVFAFLQTTWVDK